MLKKNSANIDIVQDCYHTISLTFLTGQIVKRGNTNELK